MKESSILFIAAAIFGLSSAGPAGRAACNADNCLRAVTATGLGSSSHSARLADCSSFLSFTVSPSNPTITSTVTPTATVTVFTTVTNFLTSVSETRWPTTINTEVTEGFNAKRAAGRCSASSTIRPTSLPAYAVKACSASARFSSACRCAGVTPRTTTLGCSTDQATVTAPPATTITQTATLFDFAIKYVTQTQSTALIDTIRCDAIIPIDEDLPAYRIVCEAQGTVNRTLLETIDGTDWDNCVDRATFGLGADDWEFDLRKNVCKIYDKFQADPGANRNVTIPRSQYVYAYIV